MTAENQNVFPVERAIKIRNFGRLFHVHPEQIQEIMEVMQAKEELTEQELLNRLDLIHKDFGSVIISHAEIRKIEIMKSLTEEEDYQ